MYPSFSYRFSLFTECTTFLEPPHPLVIKCPRNAFTIFLRRPSRPRISSSSTTTSSIRWHSVKSVLYFCRSTLQNGVYQLWGGGWYGYPGLFLVCSRVSIPNYCVYVGVSELTTAYDVYECGCPEWITSKVRAAFWIGCCFTRLSWAFFIYKCSRAGLKVLRHRWLGGGLLFAKATYRHPSLSP